eukprot:symbB.v1.2.004780.t2/scaffold274.1/size244435/21
MSCIFYFAGQLCILVLQEDNPFKLPSDDKIFAMREEERQRRAEERERVKHLHVWEKVTAASGHSRTRRIDDDDAQASARPDVRPEGLGRDARRDKENISDFVAKKREMFLVQMSLDVKKAEILKLDARAKDKEEALNKSKQMLDKDVERFDAFLNTNDDRAHDAMQKADTKAREKQERVIRIKQLKSQLSAIQSRLVALWCIRSIPEFLPLQLGLCCAQLVDDVWELRVHEFNLWPNKRLFVSDFKSLQFLREHGFDFNTFLEQGFTYSRIEAGRVTKKARRQDANQLIRALRNSGVPLAVHNGLLDLLHIYHGFIGDLPPDISSFCTSWISHFPLLLDTRHLAQEGRYHVLKHAGGLSLENLYRHLSHFPELLPLSNSFRLHGVSGQAHGSAGQDAMLTAKVLLMQMELWMYHDFKESQQKDEDLRRLKRMNELEVELPAGWQDVHRVAEDWGVSIYRSLVVGRFGGSRGARRPIVEIRKDIVAAQYAKESLKTLATDSGEQTEQYPKHSRQLGKQVSKDTLMFHQISCEIAKHKEQKDECLRYKDFLVNLTPVEWKDQKREEKKQRKLHRRRIAVDARMGEIEEKMQSEIEAEEQAFREKEEKEKKGRRRQKKTEEDEQKERDQMEARRRRIARKYPTRDQVDTEYVEYSSGEEMPLYFQEPKQLLDIFTSLEESNLFLIQNSQDTEQALEELQQKFAVLRKTREAMSNKMQVQISQLERQILEEKSKCDELKQAISQKHGGSEIEDLLEGLGGGVVEVHGVCSHENQDDGDTLQMLARIEFKLEEYLAYLDEEEKSGPIQAARVLAEEHKKERQRRLDLRLSRKLQQEKKIEDRLKASLHRSQAPVHKKVGKQIMFRSAPLFQARRVVQEDDGYEEAVREHNVFGIWLDKDGVPNTQQPEKAEG